MFARKALEHQPQWDRYTPRHQTADGLRSIIASLLTTTIAPLGLTPD